MRHLNSILSAEVLRWWAYCVLLFDLPASLMAVYLIRVGDSLYLFEWCVFHFSLCNWNKSYDHAYNEGKQSVFHGWWRTDKSCFFVSVRHLLALVAIGFSIGTMEFFTAFTPLILYIFWRVAFPFTAPALYILLSILIVCNSVYHSVNAHYFT